MRARKRPRGAPAGVALYLLLTFLHLLASSRAQARQTILHESLHHLTDAPAFVARDIKLLVSMAGLSREQHTAANDLYQAYQVSYQELAERTRRIKESFGDRLATDEDDGEREAASELNRVFCRAAVQLEKELTADLKALLTAEQQTGWDKFERYHRRRATLAWAITENSGAADILEIAAHLDPAPEPQSAVGGALAAYELELDRELIVRNDRITDFLLHPPAGSAGLNERSSEYFEQALKAYLEIENAHRAILATTRRAAATIAAQLPDDQREKFLDAVNLELYPKVYSRRYLHRVIECTAGMKDLDESQRAALTAIRERYKAAADPINRRWVAARIARENEEAVGGPQMQSDAEEKEQLARRELDGQTLEATRRLLTEAQRNRLPKKGFRSEIELLLPAAGK